VESLRSSVNGKQHKQRLPQIVKMFCFLAWMSFYKPGCFIILGRIVAKELTYKGVSFVIISDNLKHV
jgi:hypothetical protein